MKQIFVVLFLGVAISYASFAGEVENRCEFTLRNGVKNADGILSISEKDGKLSGYWNLTQDGQKSKDVELKKLELQVWPNGADPESGEIVKAQALKLIKYLTIKPREVAKVKIFVNMDFPMLAELVVFIGDGGKVLGKVGTLGETFACKK